MSADIFHYRLPERIRSVHVGAHKGQQQGMGMEFQTHAQLWRLPQPERIDIRASLCNPWQELMVRVFRQNASIPVVAVADLSASLGNRNKLEWMAKFTQALGHSVAKTGDRFGFIGCDENIIPDLFHPPAKTNGAALAISQRLKKYVPSGRNSQALLQVNTHLSRSSLVFLLSDFYFDKGMLEKVLAGLSRHFVVPVVLSDFQDSTILKRYGIGHLKDAETGQLRFVIWRPALKRQLEQRKQEHIQRVTATCLRHGMKPLVIENKFSAENLTEYFYPSGKQ